MQPRLEYKSPQNEVGSCVLLFLDIVQCSLIKNIHVIQTSVINVALQRGAF